MTYALTFFLFFVGGVIQGCMGFGMAMIVAPVLHVQVREVDELDATQRGSGGFGSTGH